MSDTETPSGWHIATSVWGTDYVELFLDVTLPSLLAPGNLPSLTSLESSLYEIYTTELDRSRIESSPVYQALCSLMATVIRVMEHQNENKYIASSDCYRESLARAAHDGKALLFLIPDMVLADGSLRSIAAIMASGKRVALNTGLRLVKETAVPILLESYRSGTSLTIQPRQLVSLALDHLHYISTIHLYDGDTPEFHPAGFYWKIPGEGFLLHCFHLHPVAVFPRENASFIGTIDDDLLDKSNLIDDDLHVITNSDDFIWCELSSAGNRVPSVVRKNRQDTLDWIYHYTSRFHRRHVLSAVHLHTGDINGPSWQATRARAIEIVQSVLPGKRGAQDLFSEGRRSFWWARNSGGRLTFARVVTLTPIHLFNLTKMILRRCIGAESQQQKTPDSSGNIS